MLSTKLNTYSFIVLFLSSPAAYADGLVDVKKALSQLQSTQDISAKLSTQKKIIIDNDNVTISNIELHLQLNQNGFQMSYSPQLLSTLATEQEQKLAHQQAKKLTSTNKSLIKENENLVEEKPQWPTITGMNSQSPIELYEMLSGAPKLMRFIETINFIEETPVELNNQPMRKLTFETPIHIIIHNKKTRRYVDDFEGKFHLWINQAGIPVQSELNFTGSGSFYLFFSASVNMHNKQVFTVYNNRLLVTQNSFYQATKHSFGSHEHHETTQLTIQ